MELANKHKDRLKELKESVEEARDYFDDNIRRFEKFTRFVFKSSMTEAEAQALAETGKPNIEFNILESFISRLRGEFAKQQPALTVRAADGVPLHMLTPEFTQTISVIEAHLRAVFFDGTNDMLEYNVYSDLLAGGFSVMRVFTKYINEKSFEQNIYVERVFDPTLTVFDPLARESHKGDGRFCAELYPMTKESFKEEFGEDALKEMKFTRSLSGFDWSFQNDSEEVVLVCDYYEKKNKKEKMYKLSNGHSVTKKEYERVLESWEQQGLIEQPPVVIKERWTNLEYICRYRFCESRVLDYKETDYKHLPLVFVDGNSIVLRDQGSYRQMTRPYVYHAEGVQRLKNYAGQSLANELENLVQHKFVVAIESVPEDYQEPYRNVQKADVLMYNHFLDTHNPQVVLPPPREVARTPIPPEITNTFRMSDEMTQTILGSYDTAQGVNNAQLSGVAFARSAIQSNNASVPYIVGYIKGLNRVAQIIVDLIPKYYRTPRSLPIMLPDGKRSYMKINKGDTLYMNFDPNSMDVKVETGVNFAMQKEIALQTVTSMSQSNPAFAEFFAEEGLQVILDNIDIRGIDHLKEKAEEWTKKKNQEKQMAQQMAMQQQQVALKKEQQTQQMEAMAFQREMNSPTEAQVGQMFAEEKAQVDAARVTIDKQKADTQFLETMSKIKASNIDNEVKVAEASAKISKEAVEQAVEKVPDVTKATD